MNKKELALAVIEKLKTEYPDAHCTLAYEDAWQLLVSVRLAAQCTDERVDQITPLLYEKFPSVAALAAAAQAALPEPKPVELRLCREHYPTRNYETFALPAGEYCSLQVRIGQAEGRNWWCVVYPALCRSAEGICWEEAAETAGFSDGQLRLIRVEPGRVRYRLKIAEWRDALRRRIS